MHAKGVITRVVVVAAAILVVAITAATAGLVSSLGVAKRTISGRTESIVVDRRGDAVYELGGESLGHLKCVTRACLQVWAPLEVRSAAVRVPKSASVPGTLGVLRRVKGNLFQVMLNRHPLYLYSGDTPGTVRGQGIRSFGGTWQVIAAR